MERVLLHICCAPCTIYPLDTLKKMGFKIEGFFYNPNIHPSKEYMLRRDTLIKYAKMDNLEVYFGDYKPEFFFSMVTKNLEDRCRYCYQIRLEASVKKAKERGYKVFTTTLLYSKRQKHDLIKEIGESIAKKEDVEFFYYDFREGWKKGIEKSKEICLYRQNYCGCIFSEKERFYSDEPQLL
jgi:predicted adenine nucleotide alpha hydrolase (AANH) superfamily ATPase